MTTKVSLAVAPPLSVTVTVMVAVPLWFAAGVTVTVRAVPAPPNTMPDSGTSVWLVDPADSVSVAGSLSVSPTVKAIAPLLPL